MELELAQENGLSLFAVSKLLADEYVVKILAATIWEPKSAQRLAFDLDIPIAACYRKIHDTMSAGLLMCSGNVITKRGKSVKLYKSQVNSIKLFFEKGKLKVELDLKNEHDIFKKTIDLDTANALT